MKTFDEFWLFRDKAPYARLNSTDGTSFHLLITPEERSSLFALFEDRTLADVYSTDTSKNSPEGLQYDPTLQRPDCTRDDVDIQTICRALKITSISASGGTNLKIPAAFGFRAPVNISLETAHMLIVLDTLRARIRKDGDLIGP